MGKRYIIVEEKNPNEDSRFVVYEKKWIFNEYKDAFPSKEGAISFALRLLREGENESYSRVVFDTKKDLKTDRIF